MSSLLEKHSLLKHINDTILSIWIFFTSLNANPNFFHIVSYFENKNEQKKFKVKSR